jgi:DNA-binding Lrp family transcriptional regulator
MHQNLKSKDHVKLSNQSLTLEAIAENEKLTISEITARVNEKLDGPNKLSEQTVRRGVKALCESGLLKPFGRVNNAQTFGKLSAAMTADEGEKLIPFGGELITIADFIKLMADPEQKPFTLKVPLLSDEIQLALRKMLVWTVLTSESPGYNEELKKQVRRLQNTIDGLEFAADALRGFVNSPVWYSQYRDRIGYAIRRLQEKDPELYQLAEDFVKER